MTLPARSFTPAATPRFTLVPPPTRVLGGARIWTDYAAPGGERQRRFVAAARRCVG